MSNSKLKREKTLTPWQIPRPWKPTGQPCPNRHSKGKSELCPNSPNLKKRRTGQTTTRIGKKTDAFLLFPTEGKPSYVELYLDIQKTIGQNKFSLVRLSNGLYSITVSNPTVLQQLKLKANPNMSFAGKGFKLYTYKDEIEDFIIRQIPSFIPRNLLLRELQEQFGRKVVISNIKPLCRRITQDDGKFILVYSGDYIFSVANPPEIAPGSLHLGTYYFKIFRTNACY